MKYQLEKVEKVKIIRLKEERLDTNVAPELKTLFLVWIKPDSANILIDLKDVQYVDSSGLGALLFGYRQTRDKDGIMKLLKSQNRIKELLRIAQLENVMVNFDDEEEAIQSFTS